MQNSDFPAIKSSVYDQQIILARLDPNSSDRFFLCAKDIIDGVAEDKSSLQTYEQFCNFLEKPKIQQEKNEENEKEIKELIQQKKNNLMKFSKQIQQEKQVVKKLVNDKFQELYNKKCNDLVKKLQEQLEQQYNILSTNYESLIEKDQIDYDKNAGLDKYEEIKKKVKEIQNPLEIEEYLKETYKTKIAWNNASKNLQNAAQNDKKFYKNIIQNQLLNSPELTDAEKLVDSWVQKLDQLVNQIERDEGIFKFLISEKKQKVPLQVNINEFKLIKNAMIMKDTKLIVKLDGVIKQKEIQSFYEQLSTLKNLVHFEFDADQGQLSYDFINEFAKPFQQLEKLETLTIKCFGQKINDKGLTQLSNIFQYTQNLKELQLEIGYNNITTDGLNKLSQNFQLLKNLEDLNLSFECNQISSINIHIFCKNLENLMAQLINFKLNFNGIQSYQNPLESSGAIQIIKCLEKAKKIRCLNLGFDETKITNQFFSELIYILPQLKQLIDLQLSFNNNKLNCKTAKKLAKYLKTDKLCKLSLNLSGNEIKNEGAQLLIEAITQMELLFSLELNLRNCNIKRGTATELKYKFKQKQGRQFEKKYFKA